MLLPQFDESHRTLARTTWKAAAEGRRLAHVLALREAGAHARTPSRLDRARTRLLALAAPAPTFTPNVACCTA